MIKTKSKVKYLSPVIQNELIQILSSAVHNDIVAELKEAGFYSIITDTTQDLSKVDQLSQIFRYVVIHKDENGEPNKVEIKEAFLGFENVHDHSASGISDKTVELIEKKGLSLRMCRGQGYDGASVMSGIYSGVQRRISDKEPNAVYVHCAAHNLNLVLNDACMSSTEVQKYFDILEQLYVFFSKSIIRWDILQEQVQSKKKTLKRLCPTRWASRFDAVDSLRFCYPDVLKALTKISLQSKKPEERVEATGLIKAIEKYEFVLITVLQHTILKSVDLVSKCLQKKDMNLLDAVKLLRTACDTLKELRHSYEDSKSIAKNLADSWGCKAQFTQSRKIRTKRFFDELSEDTRLTDPEEYFKICVYFVCIDTAVVQLERRFTGMNTIANRFHFLHPSELLSAKDDELHTFAEKFAMTYESDISSDFPSQLLSFRNALKNEIQSIKTDSISDLAELLLLKHSTVVSSVPDVATAVKLFLTIPVTVASAERSFSKLKLIKNYLRSTMSQERLSGLSILSIENERARGLNISTIVKTFAEKNARRRDRFL